MNNGHLESFHGHELRASLHQHPRKQPKLTEVRCVGSETLPKRNTFAPCHDFCPFVFFFAAPGSLPPPGLRSTLLPQRTDGGRACSDPQSKWRQGRRKPPRIPKQKSHLKLCQPTFASCRRIHRLWRIQDPSVWHLQLFHGPFHPTWLPWTAWTKPIPNPLRAIAFKSILGTFKKREPSGLPFVGNTPMLPVNSFPSPPTMP